MRVIELAPIASRKQGQRAMLMDYLGFPDEAAAV
jgi:hypothetical protein